MATEFSLYLIRHCSALSQHPDAPLTAEGEAQAVALAEFLSGVPFARIVSSPYERARATIAPLAVRLGLVVETDERLVEFHLSSRLDLPDWQARLRESFDDMHRALPGGESAHEATARARAAVNAVHADGPVAIVTHGRLLSLLLQSFGLPFGFEDWRRLSNPDVFCVHPAGRVERLWKD